MFALLRTVAAVLAVAALGGQASPVSRRDVIAPTITSPTAASVWPIGTTQTVTWDTSNFPPVSQITNIIGQVILGFEANNSLNLDFSECCPRLVLRVSKRLGIPAAQRMLAELPAGHNPLASGFNLTDGSVQITVPNVPPRDDYLIVLFGDSGNTSPAFSITRISAPANPSSTATPAPANPPATTSASVTNPPSPPIIGSTITGGDSITVDSATSSATPAGESTTPTAASSSAPSTTPTAPSTSIASTGSGTALGASATTSAARALRPAGGSAFQVAALCAGAVLSALVLL
ncbi:hypothetical protein HYPSUDRAFT_200596 [Hypholoma sublateritium FD-334 SS-4]|uniref:Uncharacterized protein n=1 Tax=Hypholoma sublateritium (strain FD-334 SS-4) TaxID=945553 RepID=A0A0D2LAV5_HYPSF|nr:hypothetical protein HYPSUDRAFT_200596 [Hypholoma sublateritium FD-334 SS-4]